MSKKLYKDNRLIAREGSREYNDFINRKKYMLEYGHREGNDWVEDNGIHRVKNYYANDSSHSRRNESRRDDLNSGGRSDQLDEEMQSEINDLRVTNQRQVQTYQIQMQSISNDLIKLNENMRHEFKNTRDTLGRKMDEHHRDLGEKINKVNGKIDKARDKIIHDINNNTNTRVSESIKEMKNLHSDQIKALREHGSKFADQLKQTGKDINASINSSAHNIRDFVKGASVELRQNLKDATDRNIKEVRDRSDQILSNNKENTKEIKSALNNKMNELSVKLKETETNLNIAVEKGDQKLISELKQQAFGIQDKIDATKNDIISNANSHYEQHNRSLSEKTDAIQKNISATKDAIQENTKTCINKLNERLTMVQTEVITNARMLSKEDRLERQKELASLQNEITLQVQASNKQMHEWSKEQIREIKNCHKEQMAAYEKQSASLKLQLKETEANLQGAIDKGDQKIISELKQQASGIQDKIKNVEEKIIDTTNSNYKAQIDIATKQHESVMRNMNDAKQILGSNIEKLGKQLDSTENNLKKHASALSDEERQNLQNHAESLKGQILDSHRELKNLAEEGIKETISTKKDISSQLKDAKKHREELNKKNEDRMDVKFKEQIEYADKNVQLLQRKFDEQSSLIKTQCKDLSKNIFDQTDLILRDVNNVDSNVKKGFDAAAKDRDDKLKILCSSLLEAEKQGVEIKNHLGEKIDSATNQILADHESKCNELKSNIDSFSRKTISDINNGFQKQINAIDKRKYAKPQKESLSDLNITFKKIDFYNEQVKKVERSFKESKNKLDLINTIKHLQRLLDYIESLPALRENKLKEIEECQKRMDKYTDILRKIEKKELKIKKDQEISNVEDVMNDYQMEKEEFLKDRLIAKKAELLKVKLAASKLKENPGDGDCAVYAVRDALKIVGREIGDTKNYDIQHLRLKMSETVKKFLLLNSAINQPNTNNGDLIKNHYENIFEDLDVFKKIIISMIDDSLKADDIKKDTKLSLKLLKNKLSETDDWDDLEIEAVKKIAEKYNILGLHAEAILADHNARTIEEYYEHASENGSWLNNSEISAYLLTQGFIFDSRIEDGNGTYIRYRNVSDITQEIVIHNNGQDSGANSSQGSHWIACISNQDQIHVIDNHEAQLLSMKILLEQKDMESLIEKRNENTEMKDCDICKDEMEHISHVIDNHLYGHNDDSSIDNSFSGYIQEQQTYQD